MHPIPYGHHLEEEQVQLSAEFQILQGSISMQLSRRRSSGRAPSSSLTLAQQPQQSSTSCKTANNTPMKPPGSGSQHAAWPPAPTTQPQQVQGPGASAHGDTFVTLRIAGGDVGAVHDTSSCRISIQQPMTAGSGRDTGPGPDICVPSAPNSAFTAASQLSHRASGESSLSTSTLGSSCDSQLVAGGLTTPGRVHPSHPMKGTSVNTSHITPSRSCSPDLESGAASTWDLVHMGEQAQDQPQQRPSCLNTACAAGTGSSSLCLPVLFQSLHTSGLAGEAVSAGIGAQAPLHKWSGGHSRQKQSQMPSRCGFTAHSARAATWFLLICLLVVALLQLLPAASWISWAQRAEHEAPEPQYAAAAPNTAATVSSSNNSAPETPDAQESVELGLPNHMVPVSHALDSCWAAHRKTPDGGHQPHALADRSGTTEIDSSPSPRACSAVMSGRWAGPEHPLSAPGTSGDLPECMPASLTAHIAPSASHCPSSSVRILMAVVSRCCDGPSQAKRAAVRATWGTLVTGQYRDTMAMRFFLGQATSSDVQAAALLLAPEMLAHQDLVVVPTVDTYRQLPRKTLQLMQYAAASPCDFTHVMKVDDDTYVRPHMVLSLILLPASHQRTDTVPYTANSNLAKAQLQTARMSRLYVGRKAGRDSADAAHAMPIAAHWPGGFRPIRDPRSKWYINASELPDALLPLGTQYTVGWGYLMSRDVVCDVMRAAAAYEAGVRTPGWWGRLPWEDVVVGALVNTAPNVGSSVRHTGRSTSEASDEASSSGSVSHADVVDSSSSLLAHGTQLWDHEGFRQPYMSCPPSTVAKHLDVAAPGALAVLHAAELNGSWAAGAVLCSGGGSYKEDDAGSWRRWRNSLPVAHSTGLV